MNENWLAAAAVKKALEEIELKEQPDHEFIGFFIEKIANGNAVNKALRECFEKNIESLIEKWALFEDYKKWIIGQGVEEKHIQKWDLLFTRACMHFSSLRHMEGLESRGDDACIVFYPGVHSRCVFPFRIEKKDKAKAEPLIFSPPHNYLECNCSANIISKQVLKIRFPEWHKILFGN